MGTSKLTVLTLACLSLLGCLGSTQPTSNEVVADNTVLPDSRHDMQAAFASALACDPAGLTWSIQEQDSNPGAWNASVDGSVTQSGVLSAPKCGSAWVGATIHVQVLCVANGKAGVAAITTAQEILNSIVPDAVIVSQCGEAECRSSAPTNVTVRLCLDSEPQTTLRFFARLDFTCGPVYSPPLPASYATLPVCSF